jgi:tetratricopeptide (TPR) repeat protein
MKQFLRQQKEPTLDDFSNIISIESDFGRLDSVAHYANLALKRFPQDINLLRLRSYVAQEHKKYEEAIDWMKEALKYASKDEERGEIWTSIGIIENKRGDKKRCYKAYEKALKYNPENSTVLNNLAYEYSLEGRNLDKALDMVERALELSANSPTYLDTKAWVLYKLGRYAEAKKVMQYAISLDRSKSPEHALHYGDILHALGEEFMAKTYWRKALERGANKEEIERRFLPQTEKKK